MELFLNLKENINALFVVAIGITIYYFISRPRLEVYYVENGENKFLGYIIDPVYCCRIGCDIFDLNDNLRYKIEANACQSSFWCRCPCSVECNRVDFEIKLPTGEVGKS